MAELNACQTIARTLKRRYRTWALPALLQLPAAEWDKAVRRAGEIDFDAVERVGLIAGLVFVAYLLRGDPPTAATLSPPLRFLLQFLAAAPLLVLVLGPVYLRRARRGLDKFIAERGDAAPKEVP